MSFILQYLQVLILFIYNFLFCFWTIPCDAPRLLLAVYSGIIPDTVQRMLGIELRWAVEGKHPTCPIICFWCWILRIIFVFWVALLSVYFCKYFSENIFSWSLYFLIYKPHKRYPYLCTNIDVHDTFTKVTVTKLFELLT